MADPNSNQNQPQNHNNGQPSRQQQANSSYPSPHSYPSPNMQPTYTYGPPQGQGGPEAYRSSSQGTNMSLPPLNLPPIRHVQDGQTQPPQGQPGQQPMGSPLPIPQHGLPHYYPHAGHHPPQGQPMNMGQPPQHHQHLTMRYQLPPQAGDQRMMSGGRHKKEIKRRTKTGCLTCRKRRIKCDEAHPSCRNCQKSKRECLGYDPIFKQQPGPAQIQPAPGSTPHQNSVPASAPPTSAPYNAQVPSGYAPAASAGYSPMPTAGSGHSSHENFNSSAIDPALAATDPNMHPGQPPYNGVHAMTHALKGMESASPFSSVASDVPPIKGKRLQINDLFFIASHHPPEVPRRHAPISPDLDEEFANMFANDYCMGLDALLETRWFSTNSNALNRIFANQSLREEAVFFVETIRSKRHQDDMGPIYSQEARLIWRMLGICKQSLPATNGTNGTAVKVESEDISLIEAQARFEILEALITNQTLPTNPLSRASYPPDLPEPKKNEIDFWQELGNYVVFADTEPLQGGPVDYALGTMRNVLRALEVRDSLYSIAIARHLGNLLPGFPASLPPPIDQHPEDDLNKLHVAQAFISYECRNSTQQVIARFCDMAMLSWTISRGQ